MNIHSFKVAATLAAYRAVYLNGTANQVGYPTNTLSAPIGITTDTVLDTTQNIPVQLDGIARLFFNDSVAAGGLVAVDSSGRGVPFFGVTAAASYVLGRLIGSKVETTGTVADVIVNPYSHYGLI